MLSKKIIWSTGFDSVYYDHVFSHVESTWNLIEEDLMFFLDEEIKNFKSLTRKHTGLSSIEVPKNLKGNEIKFWKKSRSILSMIKYALKKHYDVAIWLDADVQIKTPPKVSTLLPDSDQILSANSKIPRNGSAIDTGFVAFNLNHPKIHHLVQKYENFWTDGNIDKLSIKYDTLVLESILLSENISWKNLWHGKITKGKSYCGFEDSDLDLYFHHLWGKKQKQNMKKEK